MRRVFWIILTLIVACSSHVTPPAREAPRSADETVRWRGEDGVELEASFGIERRIPVVRRLAFSRGGAWATVAEDLVPELEIVSGVRRIDPKYGKTADHRWWNHNDEPLANRDEVVTAAASFTSRELRVERRGTRIEVLYSGVTAGQFAGSLRFTMFEGSSLFRLEVLASTSAPSVAYLYRGGLRGFQPKSLFWHEPSRAAQRLPAGDLTSGPAVVVRGRNRILAAEMEHGSIAVFPPPHTFFWHRQTEKNVGFDYYRKDGSGVALGVRHSETSEYYAGLPNTKVWPLYNARPGTMQRMGVYFYVCPDGAEKCRADALRYTRNDTYKSLPGKKRLATHFHMAFWKAFKASADRAAHPWIGLFRELGVDIVHLNDFHGGDGHPRDTGLTRLEEQRAYFEACEKMSDANFLVLPGEEPHAAIGGHWNLLLPRPVYYTAGSDKAVGSEVIPPYGRVYHLRNAADLLHLLDEENGVAWTSHPETKASEGFPADYEDSALFRSPRWLGAGFTYLPADMSFDRLIDDRNERVFDDMNQWASPKYLIGEVDTYKKLADFDLYGDFNVNYVDLDAVPTATDATPLVTALRAGKFFVTSGEVLIRRSSIEGGAMVAEVEWTFPLEFVEIVWGDAGGPHRRVVPANDLAPFGSKEFRIPFPSSAKWVRFAAWDTAANGAFGQPVLVGGK